MNLTAIDWAIVASYFLLSTAIGLMFTKRGGESLNEYFLSGRSVPWWLAGASMVATTFAADTPLVVTGLVVAHGVAGNWLWWNFVMSGMLTVFFFARLWRRANVMTDVEFAEIRYSGAPARFLRGFRAILTISLGVSPVLAVGICFVITVIYSVAAGLWAVLWTDLIQFVIKMSAVIILAVYAVNAVGGTDVMRAKLTEHFGSETAALSVLPVSVGPTGLHAYVWMPLLALTVFLSVQWWAAWYPGAEPGGGGYIAQRIFSARSERDGVLATLFFQVAHYAISATVFLFIASIGVTSQLGSVERAWRFLLALGAGTGLVLILRWYWWRINAWSEISAMVTSFVVSAIAFRTIPGMFPPGDANADATIMLVTVGVSTVVWISVTFLTSPEPDSVLEAFYRRVRPGGPGWRRIAEQAGFGREGIPGGALAWTNWIAGIVAVYSTLFGIGKMIFGATGEALIMLAIALAAFLWIARSFRQEGPGGAAEVATTMGPRSPAMAAAETR